MKKKLAVTIAGGALAFGLAFSAAAGFTGHGQAGTGHAPAGQAMIVHPGDTPIIKG